MIDETEEMTATASTEQIFDFTQPEVTLGDETRRAYYILRRNAKLNGGEDPKDKIYTLSDVIAILGEDYAQSRVINAGCC